MVERRKTFDPSSSDLWPQEVRERMHAFDRRLNDVSEGQQALTEGQRAIIERQERHEGETKRLADSLDEVSTVTHGVKHDLAQNSQITDATSSNVRGMKTDIGDLKTNMQGVVDMMKTFSALNSLAIAGAVLIKRIAPIATALTAIGTAIFFFRGK